MKKQNKILVAGAIVALMAIGVPSLMSQANDEATTQESVLSTVHVYEGSISMNGVVKALNGEVIDGTEEGKTTFKAQDKEIITTIGSGVVLVNGEEDVYVVEKEVDDSTMNLVKWTEAYVVEEEVFVPIEFVERVFDLTFDEESLELKKDDEVIIVGEKIEKLPEEEEATDSEVDGPKEEEKEESKEEEKTEDTKEEEKNETVNSGTSSNGSNTGTSGSVSKPTQQPKPENSTNNSGSSNSGSSNSTNNSGSSNSGSSNSTNNSSSNNSSSNNSNNQVKPETPAPAPAPKPEPQPVKVISLTTSTGNLTLEVGQSSKMSVTVNPSNADNKSVTFSSSNSGVATVDGSGNIVAKAAGTTYITAKSNENGNINVSIVVTVNEKPKPQPTYTGSTILNRVVNELGWCKVSGYNQAFIGKTGCDSIAGNRYVEMSSLNGSQGIDVAINIYDSSGTGVVSGVEAIIRWMMPSSGQQIINKLHDSNFYGGTFENMDGRKVVVSLRSFGIAIDIYPKY